MDDGLVSKEEANYRVDSEGTPCSGCANFLPKEACKLVSGSIDQNATCDFYAAPDVDAMLFGGENG